MKKSAEAFRTIGEVASWLNTETYVLRFWESRFNHIKPVKRNDGRRYYRPKDMIIIGGIKTLLHKDGLTIKGVQKILREKGVEYVSSLSPPLDSELPNISPPASTKATDTEKNLLKTQDGQLLEPSFEKPVDSDLSIAEFSTTQSHGINNNKDLAHVVKRLKILRDKIQNEIENSFHN
jgi:resuscitation-promoting factor RpfA